MVSDNTSHCFTQIITQLYSLNTIGDTSRSNSAANSLEYYTHFFIDILHKCIYITCTCVKNINYFKCIKGTLIIPF